METVKLGGNVDTAESKIDRFDFQEKPHGEGGFAKIIRGRDNDLEREVAVKVLNPLSRQFSAVEQERFRREARILAKLSHPNIPSIYDVVFGPEQFLIIFQFIEGTTLRKILQDEGPCALLQVKRWFKQLGSALEHAHELGVVHRDIKPENIIITPDRENAYLVDFGIALTEAEARRLTDSGYAMGTPGYMSPEQQAGDVVDCRSDIFSLGVTLYESLAGKMIPQGQYQELSVRNEAIPPQIDELVLACIEPLATRVESARLFGHKLLASFAPARPLSDVLAHGRLHELAAALREYSAESLRDLPEGQRYLMLTRVTDVLESKEQELQHAASQFLELLLTRAILLDADDYKGIVESALLRGYLSEFDGRIGRKSVRSAMLEASEMVRGDAFRVLKAAVTEMVGQLDIPSRPDSFLHELRELIQCVLANPACVEGARNLSDALRQVNRTQKSRPA